MQDRRDSSQGNELRGFCPSPSFQIVGRKDTLGLRTDVVSLAPTEPEPIDIRYPYVKNILLVSDCSIFRYFLSS